jgi:RNA polymerase sigma factor (sigma-70 family)
MATDEHPADTDAALLARFATAGDGRAFAALVERYGGMVLGVCRRAAGHEQDAEDAFQATFLILARKATAIRRRESIGPWLYGVATRVGRKAREASARRQSQETTLREALAAGSMADEGDELGPILDEAISRLPARFLRPIVLCYFHGQSTDAAARTLGCPKGTVLSRLARARDRLRSQLIRRGVTLSAAGVAAVLTAQATAALPLPLAYSTIQSATPAAAGTVSASVAALAKGVLTTMRIAHVLRLAAVTIALGAAGGVGLLATQAWADKPPAKEAKATLDGTWQLTAVTKNGVEGGKDEVEAGKIVLSGETFEMHHGANTVKGTFKVDPAQSPATIDLVVSEGGDPGEMHLGIYELDGDKLRICMTHKDKERPTKFESLDGSGAVLVSLKRVKE